MLVGIGYLSLTPIWDLSSTISLTETVYDSYLVYFSLFYMRGAPLESNKSDYCSVTLRSFLIEFGGSLGGAGKGLLKISEVLQETY